MRRSCSVRRRRAICGPAGCEGKFVVSYIGTMGNAHGLQTLIEAAAQLQNVAPHVLSCWWGKGRRRSNWSLWLAPGVSPTCALWTSNRGREYRRIFARRMLCVVLLKKNGYLQDRYSQQDAGVHVLRPSGDSRGRRVRRARFWRRPRRESASSRKIPRNWRRRFCVSPGTHNCGNPWVAMDAAMCCSIFHAARPRWRISTC